jgi:hypothetical protein
MRVMYCDACGKNIEEGRNVVTFEFPVHISNVDFMNGYCDNDGESVSGRYESVDLCRSCSNRIYEAAFDKFKELNCSKCVLESPHPHYCFEHGGSEACEEHNAKHGFVCPRCEVIELKSEVKRLTNIVGDPAYLKKVKKLKD